MKYILVLVLIMLITISCNNNKSNTFIVYFNYKNFNEKFKSEQNNYFFTGRDIKYNNDSIIISSFTYDKKFNPSSKIKIKYILGNNTLYRLNIDGDKELYLTTLSDKNIFFPIVLRNFDGGLDTIYGINHKFISKMRIKEHTNKEVTVYKFFVRECKVESDDRSFVGEQDYYTYYTEDFILYKKEYIGALPSGYNKICINLFTQPSDSTIKILKNSTFVVE
jgi:hypothetical protein